MTDFVVTVANEIQTITSSAQGPPGPPGASGDITLAIMFAWGDAQPVSLFTAGAGAVITKIEVVLLTAFDADATLSIGDVADHQRLLANTEIDPRSVGTYQTTPGFTVLTTTPVKLYKTLIGNVSAGNGIIFIYFE